jgi:hypothetical protein
MKHSKRRRGSEKKAQRSEKVQGVESLEIAVAVEDGIHACEAGMPFSMMSHLSGTRGPSWTARSMEGRL